MSHAKSTSAAGFDYYSVLGLSTPQRPDGAAQLTADEVKKAYRLALLLHHPDKVAASQSAKASVGSRPSDYHFSVDQILEAYETLADATLRSKYNKALFNNKARLFAGAKSTANEGLDTFDLEDLQYTEASQNWSKSCRCGGTYVVSEQELEAATMEREVVTSCHGCSLCIRIIFDTVDEADASSS